MIEYVDLKLHWTLEQWCRVKYQTYAYYQPQLGSMYATEMQTRMYQKSYPINRCAITRGLVRHAVSQFDDKKFADLEDLLLLNQNAFIPEKLEFRRASTRYIICLSDLETEVAFNTEKHKTKFLRVFKVDPSVNILFREFNNTQDTGTFLIGGSNDSQ
jgi:hypothetical protein